MENYVLITGASGDIGGAIAKALSKNYSLILGGRNTQRLEETRQLCESAEQHIFWQYDLADADGIKESLISLIKGRVLKIGGFVHSAGMAPLTSLNRLSLDDMREVMNVNFLSAAEILKILTIKKINGTNLKSVVFISSICSVRGSRGNSFYSATKGALDALARSMAEELAPNTRINVINPGLVLTKMATKFDSNRELLAKPLETGYLTGRLGQPEDVAHMAAFLMSDKASWITGQSFVVDGGKISHI